MKPSHFSSEFGRPPLILVLSEKSVQLLFPFKNSNGNPSRRKYSLLDFPLRVVNTSVSSVCINRNVLVLLLLSGPYSLVMTMSYQFPGESTTKSLLKPYINTKKEMMADLLCEYVMSIHVACMRAPLKML